MNLLEMKHVKKTFDNLEVLTFGVSFSFPIFAGNKPCQELYTVYA